LNSISQSKNQKNFIQLCEDNATSSDEDDFDIDQVLSIDQDKIKLKQMHLTAEKYVFSSDKKTTDTQQNSIAKALKKKISKYIPQR
jgi:hypothetical protein